MKTYQGRVAGWALFSFLVVISLGAPSVFAQRMPQDNWRYDGLQFAGPDTNKVLRSVAVGQGGVYAGYGDPATAVVQFQENGTFIRQFGTFTYVLGIACDSDGNVYVLDRGDSKVKAFDQNGAFLRDWGGAGSGNGQFSLGSASYTTMIAVDKNDQIYVCDPGNTRVQVFDGNGNFLRKWGAPGPLPEQFSSNDPDGIAAGPNDWLYVVVNGTSPNLRIFDGQGALIKSKDLSVYNYKAQIAVASDGLLFWPYDYYSGNNDYIYVYDASLANIATLAQSVNTDFLGFAFNSRGDLYWARPSPKGIVVYEREYSNVNNPLLPPGIPQPVVLNVAPRAGKPWLDIDYKVTDADSATVTTGALAFLNGNNTLSDVVRMSAFLEGTDANIGLDQQTGVEKRLTWNMAADWSVDFAQIQVEILAKDSRNVLGVHWVTIPAEGEEPAFEVSRGPISDAELLSVWYWFLATGQSGMSFASGKVTGTEGLYAGQTLASGSSTTTAGRLFQYAQLGVRAISGAELIRAKAGNYGLTSVDPNSVVRESAVVSNMLRGWGNNDYGQANVSANAVNIMEAKGGDLHSLFLTSDGVLWAIGYNGNGQLGDGTTSQRSSPVPVASGVTHVAAGQIHSLFVKSDGTLWAMGYNGYGQLGNGTTTQQNSPVQVASGVAQVSAGYYHSLFVKTDGTLWAMGRNNYGQLGDGTTTQQNSPVQVASGAAQVTGGYYHSLFVKSDGTLWAMGRNDYGQLGDGTAAQQNSPVQVASGVAQVAGGSYHSLFVKSDGTLWAMGYNGNGQLGDGTTTQQNSPVQVASGVARVGCGSSHTLAVFSNP